MSIYDEFVLMAQDMISEFGTTIGLKRDQQDPEKPWGDNVGTTVDTTVGVFLPASGNAFGNSLATDDELARVSQVVLVPGPEVYTDVRTVTDSSGVEWNVEWLNTLKPADVVVLYAIGVKR